MTLDFGPGIPRTKWARLLRGYFLCGWWGDLLLCHCQAASHTSSIAFRHLPPNSARTGYSTEGARTLYLRAAVHRRGQRPSKGLGTNKTGYSIASKHARKHEMDAPGVKKKRKKKIRLDSNDFGFIFAGLSNVVTVIKDASDVI